MAYENFIPTLWAEKINRELERKCVFMENTNREYEGIVKQQGDTVRILGVGKPTITTTTSKAITLSAAESIEDTAITMPIKKIAYFNYKVDDIDKRQSVGGLMEALNAETSEGLANTMDKAIADLSKNTIAVLDAASAYQVTALNILEKIDTALVKLYENDVAQNTKITMTVSPQFYMLLRQAYVKLDTDNHDMMKNGFVGRYGNIDVKMTNNISHPTAGVDLIQIKTDRAIAFAKPMTHTEAYRPESGFSDAVKGFILFDTKIVRPKELINMNVKYTA